MKIEFYGSLTCPDCRRAKEYLDNKNISYEFFDIAESADAADKVVEINNGLRSIPTIVFPDKTILVEPSDHELQAALDANSDLMMLHSTKV